jgi:hypothetical protein
MISLTMTRQDGHNAKLYCSLDLQMDKLIIGGYFGAIRYAYPLSIVYVMQLSSFWPLTSAPRLEVGDRRVHEGHHEKSGYPISSRCHFVRPPCA